MKPLTVRIKNVSDLPLPSYHSEHASGMDLRANIQSDITIRPGERSIVPTGLYVALPEGYELQIRGRSGLAANHGIMPANGIGTIDSDYRGEMKVILLNTSNQPFTIHRGDRIAQAVVTQYERVVWEQIDTIDSTARGHNGFGSTGLGGATQ